MTGKFIYAFSENDAKVLMKAGFCLLKETDTNAGHAYIFANDEDRMVCFALGDLERSVGSDTLTF